MTDPAHPVNTGRRRRTQREIAEHALAHRRKAEFVANWRALSHALTDRQRARIMQLAEDLELRTIPAGHVNGVIGQPGMRVLRCMMYRFLNRVTGLLSPSYDAIMEATGLCRQSVANGIACLERTGILQVTRRKVRQWVERTVAGTGRRECYYGVVQTTSLYSVHAPGAWAAGLPRPADRRAPFPSAGLMRLLRTGALVSAQDLSLRGRRDPQPQPPNAQPTQLALALQRLGMGVSAATSRH